MTILYITHASNIGGANIALVNIIKCMRQYGHKCIVMLPKEKGDMCQMLDDIECPYFHTHAYLHTYPRVKNPFLFIRLLAGRLYKWRIAKKECREIIRKYHVDIVHTNSGPIDVALHICMKMKLPHVWHLREYQDLDFNLFFFPSQNYFRKIIKKKGNYNIAITHGVYDYWNLRPNVDKVIYDGVFPMSIESRKPMERKKIILYVGRVEEAKGTLHVINAFARFYPNHQDYRLLIAGELLDNNYYNKCFDVVRNSHIQEKVLFMGIRSDVYDLMAQAKVLVVPSRFEGFGFITAEAMALGCLVIGRNTAGTREQFDNGVEECGKEIGLRFQTEEELLDCLEDAIINEHEEMREMARKVAIKRYTIEQMGEIVNDYYSFVINDYNKV